jgi:hypothetical protein
MNTHASDRTVVVLFNCKNRLWSCSKQIKDGEMGESGQKDFTCKIVY